MAFMRQTQQNRLAYVLFNIVAVKLLVFGDRWRLKMRRTLSLIVVGVCTASLTCAASFANAQGYPDKGISIIVPFSPGGQTDIAGRLLAETLGDVLKQTVTVVNRAGAGGAIGTAAMASAKPDGYELGITASTPLLQKPHMSKTPYSINSFDYVCRVFSNPMVFAVKKDAPINSPKDLAEFAKTHTLRYGSSGNGSIQHLAMIEFSEKANVKSVHVTNSSDADNLRNILAGVITGTLTSASVIKRNADTIKPIGVMNETRLKVFPNVPTFKEQGYPVYASLFGVLVGPKGLPKPVLTKLRSACAEAQKLPKFTERMGKLGMEPAYENGPKFEAGLREQDKTAGRLLKQLGLAK
jgi:tripartite-type tricarboxylate transporter receptor subunit TctC